MLETLILFIYFPYINSFLWELQGKILLVGVGRHIPGVLKKDHRIGGYLLSQFYHQTRGMKYLPGKICASFYNAHPGLFLYE